MIKLKKTFRKKNREFQQLYRDDKMAIYQITMHLPDGVIQFAEIFRLRVHQPDRFYSEAYEQYPSNDSFGNWAWCCSTLPSLKKILKQKFDMTIDEIPADFSFLR